MQTQYIAILAYNVVCMAEQVIGRGTERNVPPGQRVGLPGNEEEQHGSAQVGLLGPLLQPLVKVLSYGFRNIGRGSQNVSHRCSTTGRQSKDTDAVFFDT